MSRRTSQFTTAFLFFLFCGHSVSQPLSDIDQQLEATFQIVTNNNDEAILRFSIDDSWDQIEEVTWNGIVVTDLVHELHTRDSEGKIQVGVKLRDLISISRESGELTIFTEDVAYSRNFVFQAVNSSALLASPLDSVESDTKKAFAVLPIILRTFVRFGLRRAITSSSRISKRVNTVSGRNSRGLPSNVSNSFRRDLTETVENDLDAKVLSGKQVQSQQSVTHGNYIIHYRVAFQFGRWVVENYEIERADADPSDYVPRSIEIVEQDFVVEGDMPKFYAVVTMEDGTEIKVGSDEETLIGGAHWYTTNNSREVYQAYMGDNILYAWVDGYNPSGFTTINVTYSHNDHVVRDRIRVEIYNQ